MIPLSTFGTLPGNQQISHYYQNIVHSTQALLLKKLAIDFYDEKLYEKAVASERRKNFYPGYDDKQIDEMLEKIKNENDLSDTAQIDALCRIFKQKITIHNTSNKNQKQKQIENVKPLTSSTYDEKPKCRVSLFTF